MDKRGRKKSPKTGASPTGRKIAALAAGHHPGGGNKAQVSWRFSRMDRGGKWGRGRISGEMWLFIITKLMNFDSMTWDELLKDTRGRSHKGRGNANHGIPVGRLPKESRMRLKEAGRYDIEELFSLRLSNRKRIFGVREGSVLEVLWYDPDHEVCPVDP